jgi:hypothetical protein
MGSPDSAEHAFRSALLEQGVIALLTFVVVVLAWAWLRARRYGPGTRRPGGADSREAAGRMMLRLGFGGLWVFDGVPHAHPRWAARPAFTAAHGLAVNLFIVVSLAVIGAVLVSGQPGPSRLAVAGFTVLCWLTGCWSKTWAFSAVPAPTRTA